LILESIYLTHRRLCSDTTLELFPLLHEINSSLVKLMSSSLRGKRRFFLYGELLKRRNNLLYRAGDRISLCVYFL